MAIGSPTTFPLNERSYKIDLTFNGLFGELGPAGGGSTGVWTLMWCPNSNFDGTLTIVGRIAKQDAVDMGAPLVPIPYRAVFLNNAIPSSPYGWFYDGIIGTSIIEIPTAGISPAVLFAVNGGYGQIFTLDTEGAFAPA